MAPDEGAAGKGSQGCRHHACVYGLDSCLRKPRGVECHPDFDLGIEQFATFFNRLGNEENPINAAIQKALEGGRMYRTPVTSRTPQPPCRMVG